VSFANRLVRLRKASNGVRGMSLEHTKVRTSDLRALLHDWERLDDRIRQLHHDGVI